MQWLIVFYYFIFCWELLNSFLSVSILPIFPPVSSVPGIQTWPRFGFSKPMGHAGLFFFSPHSGLLSGVFALTCVQLGLLYPHYWLQVMFWTQSSWPRRGVRYIIVRRGTSGGQTEAAHVLSNLTLSSRRICQQTLLDTSVGLALHGPVHSMEKQKNNIDAPQTNIHASASVFPEWPSVHSMFLTSPFPSAC